MLLSIIIPVRNGGPAFQTCLDAVTRAREACRGVAETELIVVDDGSTDGSPEAARAAGARVLVTPPPGGHGPALARNLGVEAAAGDYAFFVDADVALHPNALHCAAETLLADPTLEACFGSYDDAPAAPNFLSQYKNLLHHYVHQNAHAQASTFWTGCGAMRTATFRALGGFDAVTYRRPSIEDIDLGYRLRRRGGEIRLVKDMLCTHLKRWTFASLLHSDVFERGIPWTVLLWRESRARGTSEPLLATGDLLRLPDPALARQPFLLDLNLQTSNRISVAVTALLILAVLALPWLPGAWPAPALLAGLLLALNWRLYAFFAHRRGWPFALAAIPWHWLYYLYNSVSFSLGTLQFFTRGVRPLSADGALHDEAAAKQGDAHHAQAANRPAPWHTALPIFLAVLAVYAALVPWMTRVWARSGDEPHYLLAAHSLVHDGDLDLNNNHAERHYAAFYGEYFLNPHVRVRADGQAVLTHNLGLAFIIAPAYALGGLHGVLLFQAVLGALLAAQVFALGYDLTRHWLASAIGAAAVAFTPPVLWYAFLVYPEMVAGLGLLAALRVAVGEQLRGGPLRPASAAAFGVGLAILPWLSSRFLPPMAVLMTWAAWRAWRSRAWVGGLLLAAGGLASYMLFSLWLYGSASPAASYAGPIPLAVERSFALLRVARGLIGWLVDNQRGLLIAAPIYIAALWGAGLLFLRRPFAGAALVMPFAAALLPVAVWGGFWTGWEYSARFLVAALPPLGAGVAVLWASRRWWLAAPLITGLLLFSVWSAADVIEQPLRGIISSPVERLKPRLSLENMVPAMARYAFIPAGTDAVVGAPVEVPGMPSGTFDLAVTAPEAHTWQVPEGQSGIVLRQVDLPEFPFGWYVARLPLAAPGAAPDTPIARIKIFSPSAGDYYAYTVTAGDLPAGGGPFTFSFHSPLYNGWGFPPTILISSTGQSPLLVGLLSIEPDRFRSIGLGALWLLGLGLAGAVVVFSAGPAREQAWRPWPALNAALAVLAVAGVAWSFRPLTRTHAATEVQRTTGLVVSDPAAYGGQAMEASPASQEPGRLAYTHPELYAPGRYRATVWLAGLPGQAAADPNALAASLRLFASDAEVLAHRWDITAGQVPADGVYRPYAFEFDNPQTQALTLLLDYAGNAGLRADRLEISPMP